MADVLIAVAAGAQKRLKDMGDGTVAEVVSTSVTVSASGGIPTAGTLAATVAAAALGASTPCSAVLVQADPNNTPDILIGDSVSQPLRLTPGSSTVLPVANVNLIYAKTSSATGNVNWILVV